jgi:hypothetical protein
VTPVRESLFESLAKPNLSTEKQIILETEAKRALAIEKLFLSLVLMTSNQADELEVISD